MSHFLESPFTPHAPAPPEAFVGRERELDLIVHHVRPAQRGNVAINGPVGSGKSTLLRMIAHPDVGRSRDIAPPGHHVVYVDVQGISPFSGKAFWRRVARLLARQADPELAAIVEPLTAGETGLIEVEEVLDGLGEHGTALVLLLDEFEWALHAADPEEADRCRHFLAQMASLARRTPRTLALVVATEQPLAEALHAVEAWRGSPFSTLFTSVTLRDLARQDADRLVALAARAGVTTTSAERELCYDVSRGRPAILQAACAALVAARTEDASSTEVERAVRAAGQRATESLRHPAESARDESRLRSRPPARGLWLDDAKGEVLIDGQRQEALTALEHGLLKLLYEHPGHLCSKAEIIREVWGEEVEDEVDDARVEKLVSRLRRKIETAPGRPRFIRTVRGRGYRYVPERDA